MTFPKIKSFGLRFVTGIALAILSASVCTDWMPLTCTTWGVWVWVWIEDGGGGGDAGCMVGGGVMTMVCCCCCCCCGGTAGWWWNVVAAEDLAAAICGRKICFQQNERWEQNKLIKWIANCVADAERRPDGNRERKRQKDRHPRKSNTRHTEKSLKHCTGGYWRHLARRPTRVSSRPATASTTEILNVK